jgi:uncharacterized DUF497 family protein
MFFWDEENLSHIARHHVSQDEAEQVIENNPFDLERQIRNGELRILHLGETVAGRVLFVVVTVRNKMLRVVTVSREQKIKEVYAEQKQALDREEAPGS